VNLEDIKKKIAGDMVYEDSFPSSLRKWRKTFKISQTDLAKHLKLSPSVLSDYETGRRKSPGIKSISKIIDALIEIDISRGSPTVNIISMLKTEKKNNGVMKVVEFPKSLTIQKFCKKIDAKILVDFQFSIRGYTLIDAERAIVEMGAQDFIQFFGEFPERAFIFTNIHSGKTVMAAVKVGRLYASMLKPRLIVLHKPTEVSKVAIKIAQTEKIALATTKVPLDKLTEMVK
jgi:putative transcriptional regulator